MILLEQSFTAHMPLLTASSTFGLGKSISVVKERKGRLFI